MGMESRQGQNHTLLPQGKSPEHSSLETAAPPPVAGGEGGRLRGAPGRGLDFLHKGRILHTRDPLVPRSLVPEE